MLARFAFGLCVLAGGLLSGCLGTDDGGAGGGSSSGSATSRLGATPSLGLITNATVKYYQSDSTTLLGEGDTGTEGVVSVDYSGSYAGPIIVAVIGDSDAQYYDEAAGTMLPFGAGHSLRAIVPSGTAETGVTILTELAYQLSLVNGIELTDANVNQLNERVRQAMAPELMSILTPPAAFDSSTTAASLDSSEAGKYALRLAALAQLGSANATPALTLAEQLTWDLADGNLDGQHDGSAISGLVYNVATFATDLSGHLSSVAGSYGDTTLQAALTGYAALSSTIDVSDLAGGGSGGAGLPSGVAGQSVTMEYCCAASGSIYNNGDQVLFTFSSSGALLLTPQSNQVAGSFTRRGSEYIWVDSVNSVEYALSVNNGAVHEVNIYGIGGSPFYGQFAPAVTGGGGAGNALTPDGDGAALSGGNGATGTVGGMTYTFTGHPVPGSALYIVNPLNSTGLFDAYDGTSAITRWTINGFNAAAGSYSCGSNGTLPAVSLTLNGVPYQADRCTIEITTASTTEVEGRFAAHLQDAGGSEFGTVTDGYFRYTTSPP